MFAEFENATVNNVLEEIVKRYPDKEAFVFGETRDTYQQFLAKVNAFAAGLQHNKIRKGDKVGINLPTCPENVYAFFALLKIGASFVPLNPDLRLFEMKHILGDSNAKAVITVTEMRGFDYLAMFDQIQTELPDFRTVFVWGSNRREGALLVRDLLRTDPGRLKSRTCHSG